MTRARILSALLLLTLPVALHAGDLYNTDFESFPVGDNLWAGTEGWISNDLTSGAQGILQDFVEGLPLGKVAYLGFEKPRSAFTTVARPVNFDPALAGVSKIEFESFLGVQDSSNEERDQFFISFYDIGGSFLAALVFDNNSSNGEVIRWQGRADPNEPIQATNTGVPFARGDQTLGFIALQILEVQIDLANNTWLARLDGLPLFLNAPFTDPALAPLSLGSIAAEWELTQPGKPGDNWLLVADWFVRTPSLATEPFVLKSIIRSAAGETTLTWQGDPGFDYQVLYSSDLQTWRDDLPNSTFPGVSATTTLTFTDAATSTTGRYYQVERVQKR